MTESEQFVIEAKPSSYIATKAIAVTRKKDLQDTPTSGFPYNQPAGSIYITANQRDAAALKTYWSLDDGTVNDVIELQSISGDNTLLINDTGSQASLVPVSNAAHADDVEFKSAASWKLNDIAIVKDGGTEGTDPAATIPTPNTLNIGTFFDTTRSINGHIKSIAYYAEDLPDSDLIALTAP